MATAADRPPVTLEITMVPGGLSHIRHVLPHQLRVWAGQVQEIVCTIDTLPSFGTPDDEAPSVQLLLRFVDECLAPYPHARRVLVDPSPAAIAEVGAAFIQGGVMPLKDWRCTAFYSYFYGWHEATHDHVLHLDSDVLFGGGSSTWVSEALDLLRERPQVLACKPLMALPTASGDPVGKHAERESHPTLAYRLAEDFSAQCFLLSKRTLAERVGLLELVPHPSPFRKRVSASQWLRAMPTWSLRDLARPLSLRCPAVEWVERHLAHGMKRAGMYRVSLLGNQPGMWQLHLGPPTERILEDLPILIEWVERGELPEAQRGRWDLHEATLDAIDDVRRASSRTAAVSST